MPSSSGVAGVLATVCHVFTCKAPSNRAYPRLRGRRPHIGHLTVEWYLSGRLEKVRRPPDGGHRLGRVINLPSLMGRKL